MRRPGAVRAFCAEIKFLMPDEIRADLGKSRYHIEEAKSYLGMDDTVTATHLSESIARLPDQASLPDIENG